VDYITRLGIDHARLSGAGFGETKPVKANDSEANRQLNRRIELRIL
jgi:flagellar motor protein MotB